MQTANPMFAKFDQALGKTTPTTSAGPVSSRADEIRSLAKSSEPEEDTGAIYSKNGTKLIGGLAGRVIKTVKGNVKEASESLDKSGKEMNPFAAGANIFKNTMSSVAAPINEALKPAMDKIAPVIKHISDTIGDAPPVQKFTDLMSQHPELAGALADFIQGGMDTAVVAGGVEGLNKAPKLLEKTSGILEKGKSLIDEKVTAVKDKVAGAGDSFKGKSQNEIMSTPEADLHTLSPSERKYYFDTKQGEITQNSTQLEQKVKADLQQKTIESQTEAENLSKELATASRDKVLELRPKIKEALGRQSQEYRRLVDEELAPHKDTPVNSGEIEKFVDNKYSANPDEAQAIKNKLGISSETADAETTIGELYDKSKSLGQDISTAPKKGTRVYTPDEKLTDDTISTITDFMKSQGVDLKNARQFWAKYAPVRNQLVAEAKPFLQAPIQTKTFANTIKRVASESDVNNENFIGAVEDLVGEPIVKEAKSVVEKLKANEKQAIANEIEAETKKADIKLQKEQASKKLTDQEFEVARKAQYRTIVKRILYTAGGLGIDKIVKRYTGIGI